MAEDAPDQEEKTEEPTARRLEKAREDGQVPRSQELGIAAVMISSMVFLYLSGGWLIGHLSKLFASGFVIERRDIFRLMSGCRNLQILAGIAFWSSFRCYC